MKKFIIKIVNQKYYQIWVCYFSKNRDEVFKHLSKNRIECRPIIAGDISNQPFWKKTKKKQKFPYAELIHDYGIYLPNHSNLKK